MKPLEYPLVRYYLDEIKNIEKHSPLAVVLFAGTLAELIMREIDNNAKIGYSKYLKELLKRKIIDEKQYKISNEIRNIRNRYVHINVKKMLKEWDGISIVDDDGIVTFVNEIILGSKNPENEIPRFYSIYLENDSKKILSLLKLLINTF